MHALYSQYRNQILFGLMAGLLILVAVIQSPSVALTILNLCLIQCDHVTRRQYSMGLCWAL